MRGPPNGEGVEELASEILVATNPLVRGQFCNIFLDFEDLEVKRDFHGRLINVKVSLHAGSFRSCVSLCS